MVNDVAVNAEGTLAIVTREGAESRRNGVVVLDLADPASLAGFDFSPYAVIINAAAHTDVDGAETDEARAHLINATAAGHHHLARPRRRNLRPRRRRPRPRAPLHHRRLPPPRTPARLVGPRRERLARRRFHPAAGVAGRPAAGTALGLAA